MNINDEEGAGERDRVVGRGRGIVHTSQKLHSEKKTLVKWNGEKQIICIIFQAASKTSFALVHFNKISPAWSGGSLWMQPGKGAFIPSPCEFFMCRAMLAPDEMLLYTLLTFVCIQWCTMARSFCVHCAVAGNIYGTGKYINFGISTYITKLNSHQKNEVHTPLIDWMQAGYSWGPDKILGYYKSLLHFPVNNWIPPLI